jgi:hypothetical protein
MREPEDITGIPAFARGCIEGMRQAAKQKWIEAAMTFFARAIINKDVAVACGEAGFSESMIFHRNKAAWLLAQALNCLAQSMRV